MMPKFILSTAIAFILLGLGMVISQLNCLGPFCIFLPTINSALVGPDKGCPNNVLTISPVDMQYVNFVLPLGNLNPIFGHVIPSDHNYYIMSANEVEMRSPGNLVITQIREDTKFGISPTDYFLAFKVCDGVTMYFAHPQSLTPEIMAHFVNPDCQEVYQGELHFRNCSKFVNIPVVTGQLLGTAGTNQNFDIGAFNVNYENQFASTRDYNEWTKYGFCPFDLFNTRVRSQIYAKLNRTANPLCGLFNYDQLGTLQGNWFLSGKSYMDQMNTWAYQLALVPDNRDPNQQVFSLGGTVAKAMQYKNLLPESQGLINRKFIDIVPDGKTYCFDGNYEGRFLIRMDNNTHLTIEYQTEKCVEPFQFMSPFTYER
jgi:hypothetical protein